MVAGRCLGGQDKTALLASFALDPPPGVRVVCFFVTARYSGHDGWQGYADVITEQLAELLHEPVPIPLSKTTRVAQLLTLLTRGGGMRA